jgi:hypothetical protein
LVCGYRVTRAEWQAAFLTAMTGCTDCGLEADPPLGWIDDTVLCFECCEARIEEVERVYHEEAAEAYRRSS